MIFRFHEESIKFANPAQKRVMYTDFDNQLLDRFEEDIKSGTSIGIESFLALCPADSKQRILLELISIEIFHCVKRGRCVSNSDSSNSDVRNSDYSRFGEEAENHANRLREQFQISDGPKMALFMRYKNSVNRSANG